MGQGGMLEPVSKSITSKRFEHTCLTHKNHTCSLSAEPLEEPSSGKTQANFLPPLVGAAAWTQLRSLTGLGHINLLTNLSQHCGNKLFWLTYIWPLHLRSHIRGRESFETPLRTKPGSSLMDRDQICSIACAENKNTYSAPGVSHPPGSRSDQVGGWPVTHFTMLLPFVTFQNNPQNVGKKLSWLQSSWSYYFEWFQNQVHVLLLLLLLLSS